MARKKSLQRFSLASFGMADPLHADVQVVCRILIVCEGEKTEPNYFKSFPRMSRGGMIFEVKCEGGRINTTGVVDKAIELRDKAIRAGQPFDSVWAVFDRDSFPAAHFNAAIQRAAANGIGCAWSNEAFELWYVYHFVNRTTPMHRDSYQKAITDRLRQHCKGYTYLKNDKRMKELLDRYGDEGQAIRFAERQAASFGNHSYADHNPATHVYRLIRQLRGEDEDFNRRLKEEIDSTRK